MSPTAAIMVAVPVDTIWRPDPHTLAKHDLLRRYLGAWFPIMARYETKLVFIDGFAGPGIYESGEPGSPLVALRMLLGHKTFPTMASTTFFFIFVERDRARVSSLEQQIELLWEEIGGQPANVKVDTISGEFEDVAETILGSIKKGYVLAPTLAFVDPFGFKGVSLDTICRLTSFDKCEVIFSFMYDGLNRWITHPDDKIHVSLRDLFGTDEYEFAGDLSGERRREFLHDLYKRRLKTAGNFKFALDFEMTDTRGKNVYSLIFATRHVRGLEAMKDAMWDVDPSGGYRFSDRHHGSTSLFDGLVDVGPLRIAMLERFAGEDVRVDTTLHEWVLAETIYGPQHYKKQVLKPLEDENLIECITPRNRRLTYPVGTVIRFRSDGA
jgi:three-Cys-motif partner protein